MTDEPQQITLHECKVCGHKWWPRKNKPPRKCPKCLSIRWNIGPYTTEERSKKVKKVWTARKKNTPSPIESVISLDGPQ